MEKTKLMYLMKTVFTGSIPVRKNKMYSILGKNRNHTVKFFHTSVKKALPKPRRQFEWHDGKADSYITDKFYKLPDSAQQTSLKLEIPQRPSGNPIKVIHLYIPSTYSQGLSKEFLTSKYANSKGHVKTCFIRFQKLDVGNMCCFLPRRNLVIKKTKCFLNTEVENTTLVMLNKNNHQGWFKAEFNKDWEETERGDSDRQPFMTSNVLTDRSDCMLESFNNNYTSPYYLLTKGYRTDIQIILQVTIKSIKEFQKVNPVIKAGDGEFPYNFKLKSDSSSPVSKHNPGLDLSLDAPNYDQFEEYPAQIDGISVTADPQVEGTPMAGHTQIASPQIAGMAQANSLETDMAGISQATPIAGMAQANSLETDMAGISQATPMAGISQATPMAGISQANSLETDMAGISQATPMAGHQAMARSEMGYFAEHLPISAVSGLLTAAGLSQIGESLEILDGETVGLTLQELNNNMEIISHNSAPIPTQMVPDVPITYTNDSLLHQFGEIVINTPPYIAEQLMDNNFQLGMDLGYAIAGLF